MPIILCSLITDPNIKLGFRILNDVTLMDQG